MKKLASKLKILSMCGLCILALCACNSKSSNPIDVIKDHYGDTQFKISFNSEGLAEPLSDVIYSANNIPKLPTPNKVGYRFAGWYFDSTYTKPYDSEYLYTRMSNVTLYAKWVSEEFVNNGIYEIEYDAKILDDTIVKDSLADKYGYLEFPNDIIKDETYIEKNDNGVFLRIQYDMHYHCPTLDDDGNPGILTYTVSDIDNRISNTESIIDRTGTIQTIYYNLDGLNIADPIKLNVEFYNWNADLQDENDRIKTKVGYVVEFDITRFIGYTTSYVDANDKLEDGYYLVKTHYGNLNKDTSMLDMFNPVYSYIIANNGHYKLVKQMNTYNSDIIGDLKPQDYIHTKTGFARDICYFKFNQKIVATKEMVEEQYETTDWAKFFEADQFGDLTYEFHADTGKYYYVFDLGDKANVDLLLVGASTGAMTEMFNMGPTYKRLVIDYSSMIKLSEIDYKELDDDTYSTYTTEPFYLSSDIKSLTGNTIYNAEMQYDFANRLVNFFYSSTSGENVVKLHNTKMTITPTTATKSKSIVESKGNIFTFNAYIDCYNYDPTNLAYPLYGDYIEWQAFSSFAQRATKRLEIGYEAYKGEKINIYDLFRNKVYPKLDEGKLTYKAYELKSNGEADFTKEISLNFLSNTVFMFDNDVALYLTGNIDGKNKSALVVVREKEEPSITITDEVINDDGTVDRANWTYDEKLEAYVSSKKYYKEDLVHIPLIEYVSYGKEYNSHNAYDSQNDTYHMNQEDFGIYSYNNGIYTKISYNYEIWNPSTFTMSADTCVVIYRMVDRYGYTTYLTFEYKGEEKGKYNVYCDDEIEYSGNLYYYYDGTRQKLNVKNTNALELTNIDDVFNKKYKVIIGDNTLNLDLKYYKVYTRKETIEDVTSQRLKDTLANTDYALVDFTYTNGDDTYTRCYVYNMRVNGKKFTNYKILDDVAWYTNQKYTLTNAIIMDNEGLNLAVANISFKKYVGTVLKDTDSSETDRDGNFYLFKKTGKYQIIYTFYFTKDENEEHPIKDYIIGNSFYGNNSRYITVTKDIDVYSVDDDITITYVTDSNHPFRDDLTGVVNNSDGSQSYTVKYNQANGGYAINSTYFKSSADHLFKWGYYTKGGDYFSYVSPDGSIGKIGVDRNTIAPVLYANWDEGITVTAMYEIDGETKTIGTKKYYRSGDNYTLVLADFVFTVPKGYTHVGWECDKPIFYTGSGENTKYFYTTDTLYDLSYAITEGCVIRPILKGPLTLKFQKYQNKEYTDLKLPYPTVIDGKSISQAVDDGEMNKGILNQLRKEEKKDKFAYWAILLNGNLIKIDLENEILTKDYLEGGYVTIVAVYEE